RIDGRSAGVVKIAAGHVPQPGVQGLRLDLRLPGQWEDEESGLYYNDQRYYDPEAGRYISPDPLGLEGGLNGYAYVGNNPLGYGDPLGLVLFAFDGTGNSDPAPSGDSISNVRKFFLAYDEVANGGKYYITGIGTTNEDMPYQGSMITGDGFDQRVRLGFTFLDKLINGSNETSTLDIDVVGFSRGAAEARAWTNQLVAAMDNGAYTTAQGKKRCLNLRFAGLWDTVPHLGLMHGNEKKYDFGVPREMNYVAHAVALNEHRGSLADFDARSIFDAPQTGSVPGRTEIGFVGSHADVGGGYGTGDLSDVALMWMVKQAGGRGINFKQKLIEDEGWNVVSNPILHDKSGNKIDPPTFPLQYGDRDFIYGNGSKVKQSQAVIGSNDTAWARSFVDYYNVWCGTSGAAAVGVVDMAKYGEWLKQQGVDIKYAAPATAHPCN
ncbi:MAG: phospholipase effector Tle1 domain-containing protein, partial [Pseudomonadota bacterium]